MRWKGVNPRDESEEDKDRLGGEIVVNDMILKLRCGRTDLLISDSSTLTATLTATGSLGSTCPSSCHLRFFLYSQHGIKIALLWPSRPDPCAYSEQWGLEVRSSLIGNKRLTKSTLYFTADLIIFRTQPDGLRSKNNALPLHSKVRYLLHPLKRLYNVQISHCPRIATAYLNSERFLTWWVLKNVCNLTFDPL